MLRSYNPATPQRMGMLQKLTNGDTERYEKNLQTTIKIILLALVYLNRRPFFMDISAFFGYNRVYVSIEELFTIQHVETQAD